MSPLTRAECALGGWLLGLAVGLTDSYLVGLPVGFVAYGLALAFVRVAGALTDRAVAYLYRQIARRGTK